MDQQTVPPQNHEELSPTPRTQGTRPFGRKHLLILGSSILLGFIILLFVINFSQNSIPRQNDHPNIQSTEKTSISEVAEYIESQKNEDGSYAYIAHPEENCERNSNSENCPFDNAKTSTRVNAWTAFANFSQYKLTGNNIYLDRMKRDIDDLIDWCQPKKNECLWVLAQLEIINKDLPDSKVSTFLDQMTTLLESHPTTSQGSMLLAIEARQLALAYFRTKDVTLLNEAKVRLEKANELLKKEYSILPPNAGSFPYFACWTTLATAEIGIADNNNQALLNAGYYLDKSNLTQYFRRLENPIVIQPCIETYFKLYSATDNSHYKTKAEELFALFREQFVDSKDNAYAYGEGGTTYFNKNVIPHIKKKYVTVSDTSYTNYLLYLSSIKK